MGKISQTKTSIECSLYLPIPVATPPPPSQGKGEARKNTHIQTSAPNSVGPSLDSGSVKVIIIIATLAISKAFALYGGRHIPGSTHEFA